jgi:type II secretory pathway pseudopilin PulG
MDTPSSSRRFSSTGGFTVPELLIAVALFMTLTGMSVSGFASASQAIKGTAGMRQVMGQLRIARDLAISQRRSMVVQFVAPNEIRTVRQEIPSGTTTLNQYFLEGNVEYLHFGSVPDTPDGFGVSGDVTFEGEISAFRWDGRFVNEDGEPYSGNIFLGVQGQPHTQRAITIFGGTGRMRGYAWNGTEWQED